MPSCLLSYGAQPTRLAPRVYLLYFGRMRAWGRGALPINKMADWLSRLSRWGYTQICVVYGTVSWPGEGDEAGGLRLWYHERSNVSYISASKTSGGYMLVCELLVFYSFTSKIALTKSKRY